MIEAAWLAQVREDTFYRWCRAGRVPGAYQLGRAWHVDSAVFSRSVTGVARQLAALLATGQIEIEHPSLRSAAPPPLTVYRWISESGSDSHAPQKGHAEACGSDSDGVARVRTGCRWTGKQTG